MIPSWDIVYVKKYVYLLYQANNFQRKHTKYNCEILSKIGKDGYPSCRTKEESSLFLREWRPHSHATKFWLRTPKSQTRNFCTGFWISHISHFLKIGHIEYAFQMKFSPLCTVINLISKPLNLGQLFMLILYEASLITDLFSAIDPDNGLNFSDVKYGCTIQLKIIIPF